MSAKTTMTAAAPATATPLASEVAFSVSSALASAISSRTSSDAFAVTSLTTSPSGLWAEPFVSLIVGSQRLDQLGEDEAAGERRQHGNLGPADVGGHGLVGFPGRLSVGRRFHHSGGSSSKSFTQITVANRVVAMVASAPRPARRPLHARRLTS